MQTNIPDEAKSQIRRGRIIVEFRDNEPSSLMVVAETDEEASALLAALAQAAGIGDLSDLR